MNKVSRDVAAVASAGAAILLVGCSSSRPVGGTNVAGRASATASDGATSGSPVNAATESNPPGDIPDNQAFTVFTSTAGGFTVKVPEGWARSATGDATVFSDKYNSIRIATVASTSPPTAASVSSTGVAAARASSTGFRSPEVTTIDRKAGRAILLSYQADSALNPVTGRVAVEAVEQYTFWRNGTAVLLTLSAPVGSDNVDPWRAVTDSLAWSR